ncbi:MAG: PQQ-binding-like beta-propeller repeat protein [Pirellula sp.]
MSFERPRRLVCQFLSTTLLMMAIWTKTSDCSRIFADDWPQWRGPMGDGTSLEKGLPTKWGPSQNVAWKIPLPEPGNSTPIVWQNKVLLTQPASKQNRRTLMCLQRSNGATLWQSGEQWSGADPTHSTNPLCSSSPVTDGERVIAWFGSAGVSCFDLDGKELWKRDLGIQKHIWGYGTSPILHGDLCYLYFGPGERSFLIALNKRTGETVWQFDDPINTQGTDEAKFTNADYYGSWSTPIVRSIDGQDQLILSLPFQLCGIDLQTGKKIWSSSGINALVYTSPLFSENTLVAMGGYNGMAIGVRAGGKGDVTHSHRLWRHAKTKQRIGSGAIHDGHIYIHNDSGIAECFNLKTGETVWEHRLSSSQAKGTNWSSVTIADGLCYTINQSGECFVFRAAPKFELVSINSLNELSNSSIVPNQGQLLIRTHQHLWCIGN